MIVIFVLALGPHIAAEATEPVSPRERYEQTVMALSEAIAAAEKWSPHWYAALGDISNWDGRRNEPAMFAAFEAMGQVGEPTPADTAKAQKSDVYFDMATDIALRQLEIVNALRDPGQAMESWDGIWRDGNRGELRMIERDGALLFDLFVTRGPTHHLGQIAGQATFNEQVAWFTDRDNAGKTARWGETWLTFVRRGPVIEVIGSNTSWYHGARAFFSGRYVRVKPMSPEIAEEVVTRARTVIDEQE